MSNFKTSGKKKKKILEKSIVFFKKYDL